MSARQRASEFDLDGLEDLEPQGNQFHPSESAKDPQSDSTPDELVEILSAMGAAKEFWVNIVRIESGKKIFCGKKENLLPDPHTVGEEYGAGEYFLNVSWYAPGVKLPRYRRLKYSIDTTYNEIHREWLSRRANVVAVTGGGFDSDLERLAKMQSIFGKNDDKNGQTLILEMVREQNRQAEKRFEKLEEQLREDRKATKELVSDLLKGIRETVVSNAKPVETKSLGEQLLEFKNVAGLLGFSPNGVAETPEDTRPAWMQAVDMIGDKVFPLLTAFAQNGGLKRKVAENQLNRAMDPNNKIVAKLMSDQNERAQFIAEICSKATTPEMRQGAINLSQKLKIPLPAGFNE